MPNAQDFRRLALALPDVTEKPHFDRQAFRTPRRIFATLAGDGLSANVRLEPALQDALAQAHPGAFARIAGGWGAQGWTVATLAQVDLSQLRQALVEAHALVWTPPQPKASRAKKR